MNDLQTLLGLLCLVCSTACQGPGSTQEPREATKPFFDLKGYFNTEVERLDSLQPQAVKQVLINGRQEVKQIDSAGYGVELKSFLDSDINKPSWYDKYQADTIRDESVNYIYKAKDDDLLVKRLEVELVNNQILSIEIDRRSSSLVESLEQQLRYTPGKGYMILAKQTSNVGKDSEMRIKVTWE